jgi:hypothetical protein
MVEGDRFRCEVVPFHVHLIALDGCWVLRSGTVSYLKIRNPNERGNELKLSRRQATHCLSNCSMSDMEVVCLRSAFTPENTRDDTIQNSPEDRNIASNAIGLLPKRERLPR